MINKEKPSGKPGQAPSLLAAAVLGYLGIRREYQPGGSGAGQVIVPRALPPSMRDAVAGQTDPI